MGLIGGVKLSVVTLIIHRRAARRRPDRQPINPFTSDICSQTEPQQEAPQH